MWFERAYARVHANRVPWQLVSREELNLRRVVVAVIDILGLALFVFVVLFSQNSVDVVHR